MVSHPPMAAALDQIKAAHYPVSKSTHFTLYEAWLALWPSDAADEVTGPEVFTGCCYERIDLGRNYEIKDRPFLGALYQQNYNADEKHTLEVGTPLQVGPALEVKSLERFGRFIAVVVWHDEEAGVWLKRSYNGVTAAGDGQSGEAVIADRQSLRAERCASAPGRATWPTLEPEDNVGEIDYVLGQSRVPLYGVRPGGVYFALPTLDTAKGELVGTAQTLAFLIGGETAMLASGTGLLSGTMLFVREIVATGGSFYDSPEPRFEFLSGGIRVATLTQSGILALPEIAEADAAPGQSGDLEIRVQPGSDWVASFGLGLGTALQWSEFLA